MTTNINATDVQIIEIKTKQQPKLNLCYRARSGVIAASNFRVCCIQALMSHLHV